MRVLIGAQICNVTSLSANQLTCKPPDSQPPALINGKEDDDELPEVVVLIGDSLQYKIGKLSYSTGMQFCTCRNTFPFGGQLSAYSLQKCSSFVKVFKICSRLFKTSNFKTFFHWILGGEGQLPKPVMIGVAVGAGLLLFLVIGILILYRRKSTESVRVRFLSCYLFSIELNSIQNQ